MLKIQKVLSYGKAKIAVLVSGGGTNLQALIDAQKSGIIKSGEIALVVSNNENAYALTRARDNNIKTAYIPSKAPDFEAQLIKVLTDNEIDIIVLVCHFCNKGHLITNCIFL